VSTTEWIIFLPLEATGIGDRFDTGQYNAVMQLKKIHTRHEIRRLGLKTVL